MRRHLLFGGMDFILYVSVTLAWDCSNREEQLTHTWCDHGCCFDKDPVRCCTWSESMGSVFWALMGLGAGLFLLSVIVGIVCCCRSKQAVEGHVITTGQESSNQVSSTNANRIPTAPNINSSHTNQTNGTVWTIDDETGTQNASVTSTDNSNGDRLINNINNSTCLQSASSRPDTRTVAERPPSYETLPPSYSSLFKTNK